MTFSFTGILSAVAAASGFGAAVPAVLDIVGVVTTVEKTYPMMTGAQKLAAAKQILQDAATADPALAPLAASEPAVELAINAVVVALNSLSALKAPAPVAPAVVPPSLPIQAFSGNVSATTAYNTSLVQKPGDIVAATAAAQAVVAAGGK